MRLPSVIHELRGSYKKNPQRRPINEPVAVGELGDPPVYFDARLSAVWNDIRSRLPAGVGNACDRDAFETLVRLVAEQRDGNLMSAALIGQMRAMLGLFAMSPSDRSKVTVPKVEADNPFERLRKPANR